MTGSDGRPVRALLVDGTVVRVRDLHEADAPLVTAFYGQLPVYDRFLRFFSAGALPAAEDVLRSRGPADVSLGAFRGETLIGVAESLGTTADPTTAEVALAVAHAEQAHGVGTLLLEHVASRARRRGVRRFVADVLAENARVRQVLADIGLPVRRWSEDGQVHVEFDLDPADGYLDALATRGAGGRRCDPGRTTRGRGTTAAAGRGGEARGSAAADIGDPPPTGSRWARCNRRRTSDRRWRVGSPAGGRTGWRTPRRGS
jgi:GNAT superfamily N-acetyltransferase